MLRYDPSYGKEYFTFMEEERAVIIGPEVVKRVIACAGREGQYVHYMGVSLIEITEAIERGEIPNVLNIEGWGDG